MTDGTFKRLSISEFVYALEEYKSNTDKHRDFDAKHDYRYYIGNHGNIGGCPCREVRRKLGMICDDMGCGVCWNMIVNYYHEHSGFWKGEIND